ncbi:MAG TPA: TolC family protein [Nitrospira sp.]|nr:TolC family protein [Nitrospira sp.]
MGGHQRTNRGVARTGRRTSGRGIGFRRLCAGVALVWMLLAGVGVEAQEQATLPYPIDNPPVLKLSLAEAVGAAVDKSPNIRLFRERIEAARGVSRTQLGAMLPHITTTGKYNTQTFFLGTIGGAPVRTDPFEIVDGRAAFTQSIFSLSLIDRWRASRSALQVAELDAVATENDTIAKVALGYFEVLRNQETMNVRSANVGLYQDLVAYIKSRQAGGMATGLDTARLETQLENERQRLELAKGEVERARFALLNAIGIGYDVALQLTDELKAFEGLVPSIEHAMESAGANRPELKAQMQRIRTAELNVRSVKGERLPSMSAEGNYGLIGNKFDSNTGTYNVGVQLSIPIFDGGQREGRIGQGVSEYNQEHYKLAVVKNQIGMEIREALVTLKASIEQHRIAEAGMKASLTELALARERIRMLNSNTLELSNALSSIVRAKDNMIDALFRVNASRVNLARAQGLVETLR